MNNAVIKIDTKNLHLPLIPITPRFASSFTVKLVDVPMDVTDVFVRVFKTDGESYFDCPANQDGNGDWDCYLIGTCFPAAGKAFYEVHAKDCYGNGTALGRGNMTVEPFSAGSTPTPAGSTVSVATLPDATGALHQVVAVNIGTAEHPDWTWEVRTVDGTNA